jgi:hypothetical protein
MEGPNAKILDSQAEDISAQGLSSPLIPSTPNSQGSITEEIGNVSLLSPRADMEVTDNKNDKSHGEREASPPSTPPPPGCP